MAGSDGTIPLQRGILYGPVRSRRLGFSLGVNLLPDEIKACSLDCRYCQYSWTGLRTNDPRDLAAHLPDREGIVARLEARLKEISSKGEPLKAITFSGNGEPTLHPEFPAIAEDLVALRDRFAPDVRTAVLSNATRVGLESIRTALMRLDDPILKLDTGRPETFRILNRPCAGFDWGGMLEGLRAMGPRILIQTLFVTGSIDNSRDDEITAWAEEIGRIRPRSVQIYSLDRGPADGALRPVPRERLGEIARFLQEETGIEGRVFS